MSATQVENITIQVKANGTAKAEKQLNSLAETLDYIEATLSNIASIPDVIGALGEGIRNIGANATKSLGQITTIGKEAETASEKISTIGSNITPSPEIETIADDFTDIGEAAETASRQMSSVDAINFANAQSNIQMLERELEEAGQKLAELMNKPDSSSGAINGQIERVKRLSAQLNEARAKVSAVSGEFNYIDARAFAGTVSKVDILNRELESANRKLAELMNNPNSSNDQITQTVKKVQRLEEELKKAQRGAKGTNLALSAMGKISDVFKKITGSLGTVIKSIARIAAYRAVRSMLKAITQGFTTGIQNLARYSNEFNKLMSNFSTYSLYLKNALGTIAEPVLRIVLPALMQVISVVVAGINSINRMIAKLKGASTYTIAVLPTEGSKNWIDYAKSIDASNKSAKKLQNTLMGFDEINRLNGDTTETTADYSTMFKEVGVDQAADDMSERITDIFSKIQEYAEVIGAIIAGWFAGKVVTDILSFLGNLGLAAGLVTGIGIAIGLFVAGVGLIAAGIYDWYKNGELTNTAIGEITSGIVLFAGSIGLALGLLGIVSATTAGIIVFIGLIAAGIFLAAAGIYKWAKGGELTNDVIMDIIIALGLVVAGIVGIVALTAGGIPALIALAIGAIATLLVYGILKLIQNWDKIKEALSDVGDRAKKFFEELGKKLKGNVTGDPIPTYASGGYVSSGQLFIAREAGAELVGSMNGHTAVANNDQIEAGIEEAAYRGFMRAMSGNSGGGTTTIVAQLNGKTLFEEVVRQNKSATTTYGKSPLF